MTIRLIISSYLGNYSFFYNYISKANSERQGFLCFVLNERLFLFLRTTNTNLHPQAKLVREKIPAQQYQANPAHLLGRSNYAGTQLQHWTPLEFFQGNFPRYMDQEPEGCLIAFLTPSLRYHPNLSSSKPNPCNLLPNCKEIYNISISNFEKIND